MIDKYIIYLFNLKVDQLNALCGIILFGAMTTLCLAGFIWSGGSFWLFVMICYYYCFWKSGKEWIEE